MKADSEAHVPDSPYPEGAGVLSPEQAMERMRWRDPTDPSRDDIYVLNGGIEKRMSTLSQQVRAISLVGALIERGRVKPKQTPLIIVGGGIAE